MVPSISHRSLVSLIISQKCIPFWTLCISDNSRVIVLFNKMSSDNDFKTKWVIKKSFGNWRIWKQEVIFHTTFFFGKNSPCVLDSHFHGNHVRSQNRGEKKYWTCIIYINNFFQLTGSNYLHHYTTTVTLYYNRYTVYYKYSFRL